MLNSAGFLVMKPHTPNLAVRLLHNQARSSSFVQGSLIRWPKVCVCVWGGFWADWFTPFLGYFPLEFISVVDILGAISEVLLIHDVDSFSYLIRKILLAQRIDLFLTLALEGMMKS